MFARISKPGSITAGSALYASDAGHFAISNTISEDIVEDYMCRILGMRTAIEGSRFICDWLNGVCGSEPCVCRNNHCSATIILCLRAEDIRTVTAYHPRKTKCDMS